MRDTRKAALSPFAALERRDFRTPALAVLAVLVLLDLVVHHHHYFGIDGTFGFAAWFGALAMFALELLALVIGSLFRASESTYDD